MDIFHILDDLIHVGTPFLIAAALAAWVLGFFYLLKSRRTTDLGLKAKYKKRSFSSMVVFIGLLFCEFALESVVKAHASKEVEQKLTSEVSDVKLQGLEFAQGSVLMKDIRNINTLPTRYHHSHPTTRIDVVVSTAQGEVDLVFGRDSSRPKDYWVYARGFTVTELDDIGMVTTSTLDAY